MILRALAASVVKEMRLLFRDKAGLVFLTIAPLIVMSVAGFSLSTLFGGTPHSGTWVLPVVDADGGDVARALRQDLDPDSGIVIHEAGSREEAIELVRSGYSGAALVVPAGTVRALASGRPAPLLLFTDPVKFVEVANVRFLVQELRYRLGEKALARAQKRIERIRARVIAGQQLFARRLERLRASLAHTSESAAATRGDLVRRLEAARSRLESEIRRGAADLRREQSDAARARLEQLLAPLQSFLDELVAFRARFEAWGAAAREQAGRFADRIPPPPEPPALPAELAALATENPTAAAARLVGEAPEIGSVPRLDLTVPPLPTPPTFVAPALREPPQIRLPRLPIVEESSVSGAPRHLNSFDQYVPGFSITFLMLGMLFGVALTLIDERDLGTLDRVRVTPAPVATLVVGKLAVRLLVGVLQMIILLLVGAIAFGVSLGPQPAALLLPTAGIVFVGTSFGVLVASLAPTRDAVLPLGTIAIVTMCAVGGCWWPIDVEPRWMRDLARWFPTTWAMSGFKDLMMRRQGVQAALVPSAILVAFGTSFLLAGLLLLRPRRR